MQAARGVHPGRLAGVALVAAVVRGEVGVLLPPAVGGEVEVQLLGVLGVQSGVRGNLEQVHGEVPLVARARVRLRRGLSR
eukprot:10296795-Alexandrium_andersonii.AAC.1